ncbi:hypothetical protein GQ457_05G003370 [Hibiscus cannabinus]
MPETPVDSINGQPHHSSETDEVVQGSKYKTQSYETRTGAAESAVISTSADQSDEGDDHAVIFTSADQDVEAASDPAVISTSADQGGANIPSEVDVHGDDGPTCATDFAEPAVISTSADQSDEDDGHAVISNSANPGVEVASDSVGISTSADQGGANIPSVEPIHFTLSSLLFIDSFSSSSP